MKKSWFVLVIFSCICLFALNFTLAHFCQGEPADTSIHGVEIDGECFNCNISDGICPGEFGSNCYDIIDSDCAGPVVVTPIYFWSTNGVGNMGDKLAIDMSSDLPVKLIIMGLNTNLPSGNIAVTVHESDAGIGNDENLGTVTGVVTGGKLVAEYNITEMKNITGTSDSKNSEAGEAFYELYFTLSGKSDDAPYLNITFDYGTATINTCGDYDNSSKCTLDILSFGGALKEVTRNSCVYSSTSSCAWNGTYCLTNWSAETTTETNCVASARAYSCMYSEGAKTSCETDDSFKVIYNPVAGSPSECTAWTSNPIPCPQQLKLPFFGIFEFIISLCMISLIYVFLIKKETL